jgi:hypothetical protein
MLVETGIKERRGREGGREEERRVWERWGLRRGGETERERDSSLSHYNMHH